MGGFAWTEEEEAIFLNNYPTKTEAEVLALLPGRSVNSIRWKRQKMGLSAHCEVGKHIRDNKLSDDESLKRRRLSYRKSRKKRFDADPRMVLYHSARFRYKDLGVPFDLKIEDIVIPDKCPVFGVAFERGKNTTLPNSPSLDRKDPDKGYVKDNVWVISHRANLLKGRGTVEELMEAVRNQTKTYPTQ